LPSELTPRPRAELTPEEQERLTAPLKMPDDGILYLRWEMQNFTNAAGKTEFRLARGYNRTEELLQTQHMLKKLSATASEKEERERKRIADNLHDRLGEVTVTSQRLVRELKKKNSSPDLHHALEELEGALREFSRGTHSLLYDLAPPVLYNVGLAAALEAHANLFGKQHQLSIRVDDGLGDSPLNLDMALFLYKAALELLRNAVKHGGADEILISLRRTEQTVAVIVEDNGLGFAAEMETPAPGLDSGFGLFSMKNRAEYYHGDLMTESSSELGGGKVTVWVTHSTQTGD
ncbi:MAG: ATP-binding protein, partial [candidate division KSB1 bacterium]